MIHLQSVSKNNAAGWFLIRVFSFDPYPVLLVMESAQSRFQRNKFDGATPASA
jgi:hypothetical protein